MMLCISNVCTVFYYEHRNESNVAILQDSLVQKQLVIKRLKSVCTTNNDYKESLILQLKGLRNDNRSGDVCPVCGNDSSIATMTSWGCFPPKNPYLEYCIKKMMKNHVKTYRLPNEVIPVNIPGENAKRFLCSECGYKWGSFIIKKNR